MGQTIRDRQLKVLEQCDKANVAHRERQRTDGRNDWVTKPWETEGAAKYYFDLAGELRVQNTVMLEALEASLIEHIGIHEVMMLNPAMRGTKEPAIIGQIRAAIQKARGGQ